MNINILGVLVQYYFMNTQNFEIFILTSYIPIMPASERYFHKMLWHVDMNELLVNTKETSSVISFNFECLYHRTPIKNILKLDVKL